MGGSMKRKSGKMEDNLLGAFEQEYETAGEAQAVGRPGGGVKSSTLFHHFEVCPLDS